jgi:hypothetical protein
MIDDLLLKNLAALVFIYTIVWYMLISVINIYVAHFICIILQSSFLMVSLYRFYIDMVSWKISYD